MSEPDLLERAFTEFGDDRADWIRPPGVDAARSRARVRRRSRLGAVAAIAILAFAIPLAAVNAASDHDPTPTMSPTVTPNPMVITTAATPGPGVLSDVTVELDWSWTTQCPTGATTFLDGVARSGDRDVGVVSVAHTDVDGDGGSEAVATIRCEIGEADPVMVVALRLTALRTMRCSAPCCARSRRSRARSTCAPCPPPATAR